jgi:hypothetical protein
LISGHLQELKEKFDGYENMDSIQFDGQVVSQGGVWDVKNGAILTLGKNKQIIKAIKGY